MLSRKELANLLINNIENIENTKINYKNLTTQKIIINFIQKTKSIFIN